MHQATFDCTMQVSRVSGSQPNRPLAIPRQNFPRVLTK